MRCQATNKRDFVRAGLLSECEDCKRCRNLACPIYQMPARQAPRGAHGLCRDWIDVEAAALDPAATTPGELLKLMYQLMDAREQATDGGAAIRLAYDTKELGAALGISERTVRELIAEGKIKAISIGRLRRVPYAEVERILQEGIG